MRFSGAHRLRVKPGPLPAPLPVRTHPPRSKERSIRSTTRGPRLRFYPFSHSTLAKNATHVLLKLFILELLQRLRGTGLAARSSPRFSSSLRIREKQPPLPQMNPLSCTTLCFRNPLLATGQETLQDFGPATPKQVRSNSSVKVI